MTGTLMIAGQAFNTDGSGYYRLYLPFKHLAAGSMHIAGVVPPGVSADWGPADVEGLDVLALQRPANASGLRMLERLAGHVKLVYETDDNLLQVDTSGLPELHDERFRESVRRCLRLCDMVTVTNEHIAETVRPYNDNVRILPNHVKADLLTLNRPKAERLTIGYAGGTTHLIDLVEIDDVLKRVLTDNPQIDLHFMGFDWSPLMRSLRGRCRWTTWNRDVGAYYKKVDFDIAVAPSADIPFNRSKTWIRALEMAAMGVPVVASNRLPYSDFVVDGKTGFLVNSDDEWRARLTDLIHDAGMRAELGAAAKEQAANWTIEDGWRLWEAAYEGVMTDGQG